MAAPTTRIAAMPWLWPLTVMTPPSASRKATALAAVSARPAVAMTSSGSSGLR